MRCSQEYNKELVETYPFLMPYNRWTGLPPEDYDYAYTELDDMPDGWRKAFGIQMCDEIKECLITAEKNRNETPEERKKFTEWYASNAPEDAPDDYLHIWKFTQIKEKYGTLRLYPRFYGIGSLNDILNKYENMSARICIHCGKPATRISLGWISPWCDDCANTLSYERFMPIEEYYSP